MKRCIMQFTPGSQGDFLKLPQNIQWRIKKKMEFFIQTENPLYFSKKIQNHDHWYRFRVGDYRIIVTPRDTKTLIILIIVKIGHRRDIYE
ncbi:type II toxin-antitoxin system RelE/ParE family toxin [Candidatus Peregrinibacteria bacterium]|nr:type II toxin-antitoxin system RelE/ParE family toxin [Candidatus Peregrinibacteria bacterium]